MKLKFKSVFIIILLFLGFFITFSNLWVKKEAENRVYSSIEKIPSNKVGLVLGTSKYLKNGQVNLYFIYRIQAAVDLFNAGKIDYILISGDNGNKNYDEPTDFKNELIKNGIPADKIYLDYAGFRTLDSVVRAKEIFGLGSVTIISQKFHNERAVFLAEHFGLNAVGFNAKDVQGIISLRLKIREYLARTKAVLDIIWSVQPKFLGKRISIG